jgi:hypothetical protein
MQYRDARRHRLAYTYSHPSRNSEIGNQPITGLSFYLCVKILKLVYNIVDAFLLVGYILPTDMHYPINSRLIIA